MNEHDGCRARQDVMAVIYGLIVIGLVALIGIILLRWHGKESGTLDTVVVGVVTAVGALLASTSRRDNGGPQEVVAPPGQPLETTDVPNTEAANAAAPAPAKEEPSE
jgi:hypothetical protein